MLNKDIYSRLALAAFLMVLAAASASAQPAEPSSFYGEITDESGNPAPVGTEVYAVVDGSEEGSIEVVEEGFYGGEGAFADKLSLDSGAGDEVSFYAGSLDSTASVDSPFDLDAGTEEVDLAFPGSFFESEDSGGGDVSDQEEMNESNTSVNKSDEINQTEESLDKDNMSRSDDFLNETDEADEGENRRENGSSEDLKKVEAEEVENGFEADIGSVGSGGSVEITIPNNTSRTESSSIDTITFESEEASGSVSVNIREYEQNSKRVVEQIRKKIPEGKVYGYLEINVSGLERDSIGQAVIDFNVNKSFIQRNDASVQDVKLNRYNRGWESHEANLTGETRNQYTFESRNSGFSVFAVTLDDKSNNDLPVLLIAIFILLALIASIIYLKRDFIINKASSTEDNYETGSYNWDKTDSY